MPVWVLGTKASRSDVGGSLAGIEAVVAIRDMRHGWSRGQHGVLVWGTRPRFKHAGARSAPDHACTSPVQELERRAGAGYHGAHGGDVSDEGAPTPTPG